MSIFDPNYKTVQATNPFERRTTSTGAGSRVTDTTGRQQTGGLATGTTLSGLTDPSRLDPLDAILGNVPTSAHPYLRATGDDLYGLYRSASADYGAPAMAARRAALTEDFTDLARQTIHAGGGVGGSGVSQLLGDLAARHGAAAQRAEAEGLDARYDRLQGLLGLRGELGQALGRAPLDAASVVGQTLATAPFERYQTSDTTTAETREDVRSDRTLDEALRNLAESGFDTQSMITTQPSDFDKIAYPLLGIGKILDLF